MPPDAPQLASLALMVRDDQKTLFVRHAAGPFAGLWSLPFIGVADEETAEDALERLLREYLHVQPGPYEFLDTVYLTAATGERFIANAFTCVGWYDDPRFPAQLFQDALWAAPSDLAGLDLLPELQEWLDTIFQGHTSEPALAEYGSDDILGLLSDARGDLLAAFDSVPPHLRAEPLDDGGWCPLDVLAHAVDVEAYYRSEVQRCVEQPGRMWRPFNDQQWETVRSLRPSEAEDVLRERMEAVRDQTRTWVKYQPPEVLNAYANHPERGVVQIGDRLVKIANHDREHAEQLRMMAQAAAMQAGAEHLRDRDETEEDQP